MSLTKRFKVHLGDAPSECRVYLDGVDVSELFSGAKVDVVPCELTTLTLTVRSPQFEIAGAYRKADKAS